MYVLSSRVIELQRLTFPNKMLRKIADGKPPTRYMEQWTLERR